MFLIGARYGIQFRNFDQNKLLGKNAVNLLLLVGTEMAGLREVREQQQQKNWLLAVSSWLFAAFLGFAAVHLASRNIFSQIVDVHFVA